MGNSLTAACLLQVFSEEIFAHGGKVSDTFNDGDRLFVRSILPQTGDVAAKDRLQSGVAMKACDGDVWIHPYVFRLVCRNGAITAQTLASRHVTSLFEFEPDEAVAEVREAVGVCCDAEIFTNSLQQIRTSRETEADLAINLLPFLARMPGGGTGIMSTIMKRFFGTADRSHFGLMNAVTSVARDTKDPELRWNLEELGGGIPIAAPARVPKMPAQRARRYEAQLVS